MLLRRFCVRFLLSCPLCVKRFVRAPPEISRNAKQNTKKKRKTKMETDPKRGTNPRPPKKTKSFHPCVVFCSRLLLVFIFSIDGTNGFDRDWQRRRRAWLVLRDGFPCAFRISKGEKESLWLLSSCLSPSLSLSCTPFRSVLFASFSLVPDRPVSTFQGIAIVRDSSDVEGYGWKFDASESISCGEFPELRSMQRGTTFSERRRKERSRVVDGAFRPSVDIQAKLVLS